MTTPGTPDPAPEPVHGRRPAAIWLVVVLGMVQGLLLLLVGLVLVVLRGDVDLEVTGTDAETVAVGLGLVALLLGLGQMLAAFFLARGGHGARALFGGVAVLQIGVGVYSTVALRDFQVTAIAQLVVSVGILWLLYGAASTDRFFAT
ncbi:hypothetical protein [Salsipaludibacter albus]|uniref:hypothetical protein n=1 Tax=Salsipaludibacter albus TaxID=2849650 RepID=UPI001EE4DF17|nr:hypothetical protein [Salsipaludibacter albus]MBY5160896.1 hypothetical protein [Salsipaludibacter albus]